jgi:hypothetical protein
MKCLKGCSQEDRAIGKTLDTELAPPLFEIELVWRELESIVLNKKYLSCLNSLSFLLYWINSSIAYTDYSKKFMPENSNEFLMEG